jgi:hypothetical protein
MRVAGPLAVALIVLVSSPSLAQHRGPAHGGGHRVEHGGWRDHDIHRFHEHDFDRWRGGAWHHERHDGRLGWWWVVGSVWYFYPVPVYPYPSPYEPPVGAPPPPPQVYYYCDDPPGYYPYVPSCRVPWRTVPAQ